ncbi:dTDP-4-amino-4,6-dideoxygalactose transaminase [Saccharicrinis sp. FJH2]|uniref:dTDP-4-amino-4,6-dideoxygalactose transaminase n=1 Tax=Saccharicrinis sp. FJH65 TaxID=3344659 RepID=UPI0035F2EA5D
MIPFNKPYIAGGELKYIADAVSRGHISGNGHYTKKCQLFFEKRWGFKKTLLTTSCTDALEMCALLLDIKDGDEIIIPSFTFVSTALAFVRQGAKIVFADSRKDHPGIDEDGIEKLISRKTKAIVVVHYAGISTDMGKVMKLAEKYGIFVVEDAAQAIDSYYNDRSLGSIGHLGTFSFHETKNIQCGEGGLLAINDDQFSKRAEIIWEKGTNRAEFFRGEINKYGWVDTGSSFLPSEITAAFLWGQLENLERIQNKRMELWQCYYNNLKKIEDYVSLPYIPDYASNNAHLFYLVCESNKVRDGLIQHLKSNKYNAVFHYLSLHNSKFMLKRYDGMDLVNSNRYSDNLIRLPLYFELTTNDVKSICNSILHFFDTL